ncbi:MAG: cysteine desulfurase family protein [Thermoanaerobaculales bacterium]|nr:cysteine desulfurase family protein [Thermoanaerobaculales bacterium]
MDDVIYLDHNATTPCDPRVVEAMLPYFTEKAANPTSRSHRPGLEASVALEEARSAVVRAIGGRSASEIVLTASATEANNLALFGAAAALSDRGTHIISQRTEHASVLGPLRELERRGWEVSLIGVDGDGRIRLDELEGALRDDTVLVSLMLANNETGVVQPVVEAAESARSRGALVHCDAVQGLGKIPVEVGRFGVDLLSLSAHKCYGPKGVGALWVRHSNPPIRLGAQILGGGQESGLRSGTPNVPGAVGFARAVELTADDDAVGTAALRDRLEAAILGGLDDVSVNGGGAPRLPNTTNLAFAGVEASALLVSLPDVAAATGSACTSSQPEPSTVLQTMGLPRKLAAGSLRLSLGRFTTEEEIDRAAARIVEEVARLRALPRRL